jgi:hypothetical protein
MSTLHHTSPSFYLAFDSIFPPIVSSYLALLGAMLAVGAACPPFASLVCCLFLGVLACIHIQYSRFVVCLSVCQGVPCIPCSRLFCVGPGCAGYPMLVVSAACTSSSRLLSLVCSWVYLVSNTRGSLPLRSSPPSTNLNPFAVASVVSLDYSAPSYRRHLSTAPFTAPFTAESFIDLFIFPILSLPPCRLSL